ncbi:hypothetical protein NB689_001924 [Xanthomonas sacchari]|nr:hypothetical protein [Xanthomonas sacchari]
MRTPPSAGPSTVLWMAMIACSPTSRLWQKTTCSWPVLASVSKSMGAPLALQVSDTMVQERAWWVAQNKNATVPEQALSVAMAAF